jgi:flagellar biosynthesis/type III secretory pathway ATPase
MKALAEQIADIDAVEIYGRVAAVRGLMVEVAGPIHAMSVGARLNIEAGQPLGPAPYSFRASPPPAHARRLVGEPLDLGVRALTSRWRPSLPRTRTTPRPLRKATNGCLTSSGPPRPCRTRPPNS